MIITSSNNEIIKKYNHLKQKKYRNQSGLFLIEGYNLIEEAYKYNLLKEIFVLENNNYNLDIKTTYVTDNVMNKLATTASIPKIIGVCKQIENNFNLQTMKRIIILDDLQDPGNIGTIIRTAVAFNYDGIVISNNCVDLYNDKIIRATQGAIFKIPIITNDLLSYINILKDNNFYIIGTSLNKAISLNDTENKDKIALIFGNEGNGINQNILNKTDINIKIPINNIESLNVAIAASICMYHFQK